MSYVLKGGLELLAGANHDTAVTSEMMSNHI